MTKEPNPLQEMNTRSREVFRRIVESYLETGDPVGSRTLSRSLSENISAATIRNVMQDLEIMGLLDSPHISAGRLPTEQGLRVFVDGLLEFGDLNSRDRKRIEASMDTDNPDVSHALDRIGQALSGLTQGASLVLAPKTEAPLKHIEFVNLAADRAMVVLVFADGQVENRIFNLPPGQTPSSLREAANFINDLAEGNTLPELRRRVEHEVSARRAELDILARELVEDGLAIWDDDESSYERLIVRGRSNLIDQDKQEPDLERVRQLFDDLERKRDIVDFLELAEDGEGVRIFIGSENKLFSLSGSSLVVSPYMNADRKIIGAVGVIGPTRLNYGRIVPIVDYTAQLVGEMMTGRS